LLHNLIDSFGAHIYLFEVRLVSRLNLLRCSLRFQFKVRLEHVGWSSIKLFRWLFALPCVAGLCQVFCLYTRMT
jgi:hypothetical protein